jgi:anti-anti-sigma factor
VELTERRTDNAVVVAPSGRIDLANADQFRDRLIPLVTSAGAAGQGVVIDFSSVDYISSQGLRVLMLAAKQAKASGANIAIASLAPLVVEIFQITRFDKVLPVHKTVDAAVVAVAQAKA